MNTKEYIIIEVKGLYLCKVYATRAEVNALIGPCITWTGNSVNVWGKP